MDIASLAWDNRDAIAGAASDVWNAGWAEAQNEDLLGDAVNFGLDHQDEIGAAAGAAWDAVSSMGWAETEAKTHQEGSAEDLASKAFLANPTEAGAEAIMAMAPAMA